MYVGFKKNKHRSSWVPSVLLFWLAASCFINLGREAREAVSCFPEPQACVCVCVCVHVCVCVLGGVSRSTSLDQLLHPSAAGAGSVVYGHSAALEGLSWCSVAAGVNGSGKINSPLPQHQEKCSQRQSQLFHPGLRFSGL